MTGNRCGSRGLSSAMDGSFYRRGARSSRHRRGQGHVALAPFAVFFYTLVVEGCSLDRWPGWYYALQRLLFETMLALHIIERRFTGIVEA
jgi:hypothetical protein